MNVWDIVILLIVGAAAMLAVRRMRGKKAGGCGCGCGCEGCPGCKKGS